MSTRNKVLILVASVWPLLYLLGFVVLSGSMTSLMKQYGEFVFFIWFILHVSAMISWFAVTFVFQWHVLARNKIGRFGKTVWVVALSSFGPLAFPVYWALYIVRDRGISSPLKEEPQTQITSQTKDAFTQTKASRALTVTTFWPISYMTIFVSFFLGVIVSLTVYSNLSVALPKILGRLDVLIVIPFGVLLIVHIGTMLLLLGVYLYYLVNPFINSGVPQEQKIPWFLMILFGHIYVWPFYWYFNVLWKGENFSL